MKGIKNVDSPRLRKDNKLEVVVVPHSFSFKNSEDKKLNDLIVDTINFMGGFGDSAEQNYQLAIRKISARQDEVVKIIFDELADIPKDKYLDRWSLVYLLTELKNPGSLNKLAKLIESRIPAEQSKQQHNFSTVGEEVMIRTTAVEGISRMASDGNKDALEILYKNVSNKNFSIKRACIQAILVIDKEIGKKKLLKFLPKSDHFILNITRKHPSEANPLQGELHLKNRNVDELPPLFEHQKRTKK